jgi:hypothetical protein
MDAVIRSKVLYGLESAQINEAELRKLTAFRLKGFRKVLKLDTTYVNRQSSHELVFNKVNSTIREEGCDAKLVKPFSEAYAERTLLLYQQLVAAPDNDPVKCTTISFMNLIV